MKKLRLFLGLKKRDKVKLLYGKIGVVENVVKDEKILRVVVVHYQDGTKTYVLHNEDVEIL